jgi:flagellum-specific peptidoglycan hydrolase FlgJ
MADNKNSSWIENQVKQNLYSAASLANKGMDKIQEIKQDYRNFGKQAMELPGQLSRNSAARQAIVERENKSNALTESQKQQLKYISNAEEAQKFVDASIMGNENGDYSVGQKTYNEALKGQGKAWLGFGEDVATTFLGGKGLELGAKVGSKVFKGAAESLGSRIPSLGKISNVFKSEATLAQEAKAAAKAENKSAAEAEAKKKAQDYVQQQRQQTGKQTTPFTGNVERAATNEAVATEQAVVKTQTENLTKQNVRDAVKAQLEADRKAASRKSMFTNTMLTGAAASAGYEVYNDPKHALETVENAVTGAGDIANDAINSGIEGVSKLTDNPEKNEKKWKEKYESGKSWLKDSATKLAGPALGAYVAGGSSPFRAAAGGMGALFASGNSAEATLSSMPSGGDSGTTGESHFGSSDMSGKTVIEVLNKIYGILSKVYDTVENIANDTASMVRGQSQQDAARDLSSSNLRARQNEGGGFASPIFGGGGGESSADLNKEDETEAGSGIWSKVLKKIPLGKVLKGAAVGGAAVAGLAYSGTAGASDTKNAEPIKGTKSKHPDKNFQEHYDKVYNLALKEAKERGLENPEAQAHLAAAQSVEETGGGKHTPKHNLFGIKYSGKGQGTADPTGELWSPEERGGKNTKEKSRFRGYKTEEDSVKDRFDFLEQNKSKRYDKALKSQTPEQAIAEMGSSGYATSSRYGKALAGHYATYGHKTGDAPSDEIKTASPITPKEKNNTGFVKASYNPDEDTGFMNASYNNVPDSEKLDAPKSLIYPDSNGRMQKQDLETGEEFLATEEDIKQDKAQKELEAQWVEKHKNTGSSQLQKDVDKTAELYVAANPTASFVDKPKSTASPILKEVSDIDNRKAELKAEIEQQSLHTAYPDKESMDKDLNRLNEIYAETDKLDEKRNNIVASDEYKSASAASKQQAPSQQQAAPQQAAPPPRNNPGSSKSVPSVRNDDPTIKMMEEGNMWRTNTHEA